MADRLPPHYLELVSDAALKSYWRHRALWQFLRRCGVADKFLATWIKPETKREFLTRLFPILEMSDAGVRLINRMADSLAQQTTFPDLEDWEDSEHKKDVAKKSIEALKVFISAQQQHAETKRDHEKILKRSLAMQEEALRRRTDLEKLSSALADLSKRLGTQQAGYDFQNWFYDLVGFFEVIGRRPYVAHGRQIDGSVTVDGTTYLVELKFTTGQATVEDIDTFHKKVSNKADNTMGIMVSISGFSSVALGEASGPKTPLLLLDHNHVYLLLGGTVTLQELIGRVRRHSSQTGEAYLGVHDFGG